MYTYQVDILVQLSFPRRPGRFNHLDRKNVLADGAYWDSGIHFETPKDYVILVSICIHDVVNGWKE
jgi:hypothetical protein